MIAPSNKIFFLLATLLFIFHSLTAYALEKNFYILHYQSKTPQFQKILENLNLKKNKISILITQAYHIDKKGNVTGFINPEFINFAKDNNVKLMALLTNSGFDTKSAHQFLSNSNAITLAIHNILKLCQANQLYGIQIDFEMIPITDKNNLTAFYKRLSSVLHQNGFKVSIAIAPTISDGPFSSAFRQRSYNNYEGAYDLQALKNTADFFTLMAYNQHLLGTTPGPVASINWLEKAIKHALVYIPADKISLGIPTYSGFWYTDIGYPSKKISVHFNEISFDVVDKIIKKNNAKILWDADDGVNYAFYQRDWLNQFLFIENSQSFKLKLALAKKYHLRGISVFRFGSEDQNIWNFL